MKNKQLPATTADHRNELIAKLNKCLNQINSAKNPDPKDVESLRQFIVQTPGFLSANSTTESVRQQLIEKISHGTTRAIMLAEMDVLKRQLDYEAAPPLERLLIDHILTVRLRLIHAEHRYNECVVNQPFTFQVAEFRDNLLASTQARFIRAIEALARVRRLARNTPALQINIASEGGKQVNVQGDVNGKKAAPAGQDNAASPPLITGK
jgi:hypothetical protein